MGRNTSRMVCICAAVLSFVLFTAGCGMLEDRALGNSDQAVLDEVPEYAGEPYTEVEGNRPGFTVKEIKEAGTDLRFFSEMDSLGRCGSAVSVVGRDTMPDGEREPIGMVRPSGWQLQKYDFIDNGGYLFNRCHLIGWQLTGENEEPRNLITGTRYMNTEGMLPFENRVAEYVRRTGNHVLYRSTPVFRGKELVARGVQLEAYSVEDRGRGVSFNVFCYNVQPGVEIEYLDGTSRALEQSKAVERQDAGKKESSAAEETNEEQEEYPPLDVPEGVTYVLNNNTMRFHRTDCRGARSIWEHNRSWFYGTREEAVEAGYVPCGMCEP